ncbi:hypothetical protein OPV22_006290 [Ensete ventricosum]|uniref:Uncharacterized protein n=1 Tax=Ensete ventricosum TaxID=4639 RepID=A0AAV8RMU1_ENSVE|nr:hypothetical protein OPV22_006290 [Ensete ventricosum]
MWYDWSELIASFSGSSISVDVCSPLSVLPSLSPVPLECLRSVAFPVNPSILKPVCADVLPAALRNRPPGLEFYPSSHRLSAVQTRFYAGNGKISNFSISPVINYVPKKYKLTEANWQSSSVDKTSGRSQRRREAWLYF